MIPQRFEKSPPAPLTPIAYSLREAAAALRVSERTAWELVRTGRLQHSRLGRRIVIARPALEKLLAETAVQA